MLCGGGDVPVDTEWLFKSFPRIFSSSDVLSALEVFATEEDVNIEDDSEDKFLSTGDVVFTASFACEATAVIVVSEFSTRESSGAITSENHKFAP